jgi:hypothetical protein
MQFECACPGEPGERLNPSRQSADTVVRRGALFSTEMALGVSHGWDDTVECSFDVPAGFGVELVLAVQQFV